MAMCKDCVHFVREQEQDGNITAERCEINRSPAICGKKLLTVKEVAIIMGLSIQTLYNWINSRKIPYYKVGHSVRFKLKDIEQKIEEGRVEEIKL